jgi:CheY-like chemotaxis protein
MDTAGTIQPLVEENGNHFEIDCAHHLGAMRSDKTKLRQVLFNLLGNAAKFTEDGTVTLRAHREEAGEEEEGDWVHFAVEDTGIGLTDAEQARLFEAFSQADSSLTREHEGTGLGLVISRNLCRMMGGDIELESEKDVGSTFTVRLPAEMEGEGGGEGDDEGEGGSRHEPAEELTVDHADLPNASEAKADALEETVSTDVQEAGQVVKHEAARAEGDSATEAGSEPDEPGSEDDDAGDQTVLVIDDDPTAREIIGRRLEKDGFTVATAEGGQEGLEKARALRPAVITLDVMMPEVDGWAVLTALQRDEALHDIPVVMVTIVEDENIGYMLGANDYLTKPVEANRLVSVVRRHSRGSGSLSVLIVEDDPSTRELIRRTLEDDDDDCVVREARHGRVALDLMEQDDVRPNLILLDLMMPEVDGFAFLEELRARQDERPPIPVVVVTAKDLTAEERARLRGEVDKILQKGNYDREELLREVQRSVDEARAR